MKKGAPKSITIPARNYGALLQLSKWLNEQPAWIDLSGRQLDRISEFQDEMLDGYVPAGADVSSVDSGRSVGLSVVFYYENEDVEVRTRLRKGP